jgi:hypothetical protein
MTYRKLLLGVSVATLTFFSTNNSAQACTETRSVTCNDPDGNSVDISNCTPELSIPSSTRSCTSSCRARSSGSSDSDKSDNVDTDGDSINDQRN